MATVVSAPASQTVLPTDGELLMRFTRHGDREAFAQVVERHRPMVWGVCSRVLVRHADAEDAYQATLLILAKKAGSIRANDSAGGWLFRVAHNAALQSRRRRKSLRETPLEESPPAPEPLFPDLERRELFGVLLEELRALPTKYQTPLVLRYLEGQSRHEIATAIDATTATVAGILVRGRRMLRSRLARRGVSLAVVLAAAGHGSTSHAAGTVHAAPPTFTPTLLTAGVPTAVSTLVNQGIRSMLFTSYAKPTACGLAAAIAALMVLNAPDAGLAQTAGEAPIVLTADAPTDEQPAAADGATAQLAPKATPPKADNELLTKQAALREPQAIRNPSLVEDDPLGAESENPIHTVRKDFTRMVASLREGDLAQPTFVELHWSREHWITKSRLQEKKYARLLREWKDKQKKEGQEVTDKAINEFQESEPMLAVRSERELARARALKAQRLMKLAALRETRAKGAGGATIQAAEEAGPSYDNSPSVTNPIGPTITGHVEARRDEERLGLMPEINAVLVPAAADKSDAFESLRKHYAKLAAAKPDRDLSQPSFEELHWQANHWRANEDALRSELDTLEKSRRRIHQLIADGLTQTNADGPVRKRISEVMAELPLAKGKIAEYERQMKLAALRETRPRAVGPRQASVAVGWPVPHSLEEGTGPLPTKPPVPPVAPQAPTVPVNAAYSANGNRVGAVSFGGWARTRAIADGAKLEPGDTLLFEYHSDESPTPSLRRCTVDKAGLVDLGSGFGTVEGAGKTLPQVNALIEEQFAEEQPGLDAKLHASNRGGAGASPPVPARNQRPQPLPNQRFMVPPQSIR